MLPDIRSAALFCLALVFFGLGPVPDSLNNKPGSYFRKQLERDDIEPSRAWVYARAWLSGAQRSGDFAGQGEAYKAMVHLSEGSARLAYADSMVAVAYRGGKKEALAAAYLTKGVVFYQRKQLGAALKQFIAAERNLRPDSDPYLAHKVRFQVANIKSYLGYYEEVIPVFREAAVFYDSESIDEAYLACLHNLALAYGRTGRFEQADRAIAEGMAVARARGDTFAVAHLQLAKGLGLSRRGRYREAVKVITGCLAALRAKPDPANEQLAAYHLGKCHWALSDKAKAVEWFVRVDSLYRHHGYIRPQALESYERLIDYYRAIGDRSREVYYIDRLLAIGKALRTEFSALSLNVTRYDHAALSRERVEALQALAGEGRKKRIWGYTAAGLGVVAAGLLIRHYRLQRTYRRRFRELMEKPAAKKKEVGEGPLEINPEIVAHVRKCLERFEAKGKFLEKELTQARLAVMFRTNYKYVARIIQHDKGKSSSDYITDLKIDYIVGKLMGDARYRHYTNAALAEECGFATTQHFVGAFRKKMGMPPTVFVGELKRQA